MISEFADNLHADAHDMFQEWRLENPEGFFIKQKGKGMYLLHHVGCAHIGNPFWGTEDTIQSRERSQSLTTSRKICSSDPKELLAWLVKENFAHEICHHCVDSNDPSHLKPSVSAMQRMDRWIVSLNQWVENHQGELENTTIQANSDAVEDDAQHFYNNVSRSLQDSQSSRQARLATAPKIPDRTSTTSTSFRRNPDVVAEVLLRAKGKCEGCLLSAPFTRASDGTPYLEVRHRVMLAADGEDTVANAIALCPNCHRAARYA
ncbi:MAG: HNH endonuclease [Candidatus Brocadiaceae bacterium]|nr:HNH endonuclease [Candidatus Brocadiaceae bacterium]